MINRRRSRPIPNAYLSAKTKNHKNRFTEDIADEDTDKEHNTSWEDENPAHFTETDIPESHNLPEKHKCYEKFAVITETIDDSCWCWVREKAYQEKRDDIEGNSTVENIESRSIFLFPYIKNSYQKNDGHENLFAEPHRIDIQTLCTPDSHNNGPREESDEGKRQ